MFTLLTLALSSSAAVGIGQTFGNAYAGLMICQGQPDEVDTVILNYTISSAHDHGVLNHFWVTGTYTYDRILCRRRGITVQYGKKYKNAVSVTHETLYGAVLASARPSAQLASPNTRPPTSALTTMH